MLSGSLVVMAWYVLRTQMARRVEQVNGGHLRGMQDKTISVRKLENSHKRAFGLKGILPCMPYEMRST